MNKNRLIWGIVCVAIAAGMAALIIFVPPNHFQFNVGERNMPWIPALGFAVGGTYLLATAPYTPRAAAGEDSPDRPAPVRDPEKAALNKRLETVAWGIFLILLGGFLFVPKTVVSEGSWSIAVGLVLLGLNVARYINHVRMSGFTTILGVISIVGGIVQIIGMKGIEGAVLIIILGAYLIFKPRLGERRLFGKAEEA